jgi:hypothetical protein
MPAESNTVGGDGTLGTHGFRRAALINHKAHLAILVSIEADAKMAPRRDF